MSTVPADSPLNPKSPASKRRGGRGKKIDYEAFVTEDHQPVDRIFIEKLYRLLTRPLYASWTGPADGRSFLVLVNVGWFYDPDRPAVAPDCLLSLGVSCPENLQIQKGHSYYQWDMGKSPEVVIEMVSDSRGDEEVFKKSLYARMKVRHYAVYDPKHILSGDTLRTYELKRGKYRLGQAGPWEDVGLGLRLWTGTFEGVEDAWLRWCDAGGEIIPTGEERAVKEAQRAAKAAERAARAAERATQEAQRATKADERATQEAQRATKEAQRAADLEQRNRLLQEEIRRLKGETP